MKQEIAQPQPPKELRGECQLLDKKVSGGSTPKPRFKHVSFLSGQTFYLYGGTGVPCTETLESALQLHWVELGRNNLRWERGRLKCASKDLQSVSGLAVTGQDNQWYFFGGSNGEFRCNNHLWRMNLKQLQMVHMNGYGQVPAPRESAAMVLLGQWLLIYGGVNTNQLDIYNSMHCYNLKKSIWHRLTGTYLNRINPRHDSSLCLVGQSLYLFGGTYRNATQNQQMYLNDLYQLKLTFQTGDLPPTLEVKRLISADMPQARSGHGLVPLGDHHLLLVGGENSKIEVRDGVRSDGINLVPTSWVYNIPCNLWIRVDFPFFKPRTSVSTCYSDGKVYIYGGLQSYLQLLGDLTQLSVPRQQLEKIPGPLSSCMLCQPQALPSPGVVGISGEMLQEMGEEIEFPFSALGMLVDNAVLEGATTVNISYDKQRKGVLRVQDNARLPWSEEQFLSTMSSFKLDASQIMSGIEKKTRTFTIRQNQRRQFGTYCKLASLRLGSGFLHVSHADNNQSYRVCLFAKDPATHYYTLTYYSCFKDSGEVTNPHMTHAKEKVESQYSQLILKTFQRQYVRNTILVLEAKIMDWGTKQDEAQLIANYRTNDIICCSCARYRQLEELGYNVDQCIDISLRAYLISFYLKNEMTKITLGVGTQGTPIATQIYLERLDKLKKHRHVLEVTNLMEFDVKIFELYYLYDLTKRVNYFSNGILLYHKNRLITRYKYPLGTLSQQPHRYRSHNFIRFFGFFELPDHVYVNPLKTNVNYQMMLNKLYSKFALLQKIIEQHLRKLHLEGPLKRLAPTKQSLEEMRQDQHQNLQLGFNCKHQQENGGGRQHKKSSSARMEAEQADKEQQKSSSEKVAVLNNNNNNSNNQPKTMKGENILQEEECQIKLILPIESSLRGNKPLQHESQQEPSEKKSARQLQLPQADKEEDVVPPNKLSFPIKIVKGTNSSQKEKLMVGSDQGESDVEMKGEGNGKN